MRVFKCDKLLTDSGSSCSRLSGEINLWLVLASCTQKNRIVKQENWSDTAPSHRSDSIIKCLLEVVKLPFAISSSKDLQLPIDSGSVSSRFSLTSNCIS